MQVDQRIPIETDIHCDNRDYLKTKVKKMSHMLSIPDTDSEIWTPLLFAEGTQPVVQGVGLENLNSTEREFILIKPFIFVIQVNFA